ncbi:MAG: hypothetical protein NZ602_13100 [Thermoguttaceae bacterium]|nr:hypothetical protein [Thermoguttaceae bacterium]MDW8038006.1 hypothetical protein [Thermoguttaceae bacterium]
MMDKYFCLLPGVRRTSSVWQVLLRLLVAGSVSYSMGSSWGAERQQDPQGGFVLGTEVAPSPLSIPLTPIVWETGWYRLQVDENARWCSLQEKATGQELLAADGQTPMAKVVLEGKPVQSVEIILHSAPVAKMILEGKTYSASRILKEKEPDQWLLRFAGCATELVYTIRAEPDWVLFRLEKIRGPRPSRITLLEIPVRLKERVGLRLNAAWDGQWGICVMAANRQTEARPVVRPGGTLLTATSQDEPGPKLEGSAAVLVVAPIRELRRVLQKVSVAFDLPRNEKDAVPSKELPIARGSYWFLSFGEKDVDRVIELCQRTGFQQVFIDFWSWSTSPGHYPINKTAYPDGLESLRRTVARLHEQGILVGMHTFASKVSKRDPYVTPVPDRRFLVVGRASLAEPIDPAAKTIRLKEDLRHWPGSPLCPQKLWEGGIQKHQEVVIDDEIIHYQAIGPEGRWDSLLGCTRGAWGTKPAAHSAGTECRRYGVDGCINGYIIDQETDLFDEVTSRLAQIFNACDFDMIYFDGSEDVDTRRFEYYAANAHAAVMEKIRKRPIIHQGGGFHHNLWHSFTRSGTVDTYLSTIYGYLQAGGRLDRWPTVREHINRSVQYVESLEADMIPGELGWFGIWPKGKNTDGLQLDEIEYLMAKSLALDAPISLQTSFAQMDQHPLTPEILEIVRTYEVLRRSGRVGQEVRKRLREMNKNFVLYWPEPARQDRLPEFVEVRPLPMVASNASLRALLGSRKHGTLLVIWHSEGKNGLLLLKTTADAEARQLDGQPILLNHRDGKLALPIGGRRLAVWLPNLPPETVQQLCHNAQWQDAPSTQ